MNHTVLQTVVDNLTVHRAQQSGCRCMSWVWRGDVRDTDSGFWKVFEEDNHLPACTHRVVARLMACKGDRPAELAIYPLQPGAVEFWADSPRVTSPPPARPWTHDDGLSESDDDAPVPTERPCPAGSLLGGHFAVDLLDSGDDNEPGGLPVVQ